MKVEFDWISSNIEPELIDEPVMCLTVNNKIQTFKNTKRQCKVNDKIIYCSDWKHFKNKYCIKYWTYQNNLIPRL